MNLSGGIDVAAALNEENQRIDGRQADELRSVKVTPDYITSAKGSVLIEMGQTRVICTASVDESVPGWMRYQNVPGGWLTAEYSMLPEPLRIVHSGNHRKEKSEDVRWRSSG